MIWILRLLNYLWWNPLLLLWLKKQQHALMLYPPLGQNTSWIGVLLNSWQQCVFFHHGNPLVWTRFWVVLFKPPFHWDWSPLYGWTVSCWGIYTRVPLYFSRNNFILWAFSGWERWKGSCNGGRDSSQPISINPSASRWVLTLSVQTVF